MDRRRVRERIGRLKRRLHGVAKTRRLQRKERESIPYPTVALVGYTNSGKSTLMNRLTRAGVLVEDKLFATLDPRTRALRLLNGERVMLVDTVGFINKIPHTLMDAFKATLEEIHEADLLLCVMDPTSPLAEQQLAIVESVLDDIGAAETPRLVVPNKTDIAERLPLYPAKRPRGRLPHLRPHRSGHRAAAGDHREGAGSGKATYFSDVAAIRDGHRTVPAIPRTGAQRGIRRARDPDHGLGDGQGLGAGPEAGGRQRRRSRGSLTR